MSSTVSIEEALILIDSGYKTLPPALQHLKKKLAELHPMVDKKQYVKNAFLLGYGESVILAMNEVNQDK